MNLAALVVAGLALAAPIAYIATDNDADGASVGMASRSGDAPAPTLTRHEGVDHLGVLVGVPYPTCPLQCTVGYGFLGQGAEDFEVPAGATRVDVVAHWTASTPTTRDLEVGLYHQDDECGEGCYLGLAGERGSERVAFSLEDPPAGLYHVSAHPSGPAYVAAQQDVWFEVLVWS